MRPEIHPPHGVVETSYFWYLWGWVLLIMIVVVGMIYTTFLGSCSHNASTPATQWIVVRRNPQGNIQCWITRDFPSISGSRADFKIKGNHRFVGDHIVVAEIPASFDSNIRKELQIPQGTWCAGESKPAPPPTKCEKFTK